MKLHFLAALFLTPLFFLISCKKDSTTNNNNNSSPGNQLYRMQQGTDPTQDTVFHIIYSGNNISKIYDSIFDGETMFPDTLTAFYDANGRIASITSEESDFSATFTYNANGLPTEIDAIVEGERDNYTYTYNNGVLAQKSWASDLGSGPVNLYETFAYTVANGNITEVKEYDLGNTLISDKTFTYGSQPNTLKQLGLFDIGGELGTDDIASFDTYFNKNIITSYSQNGASATMTNIFNSQQSPTKITEAIPEAAASFGSDIVFTWQFSYH